jgi:hypothetical protein
MIVDLDASPNQGNGTISAASQTTVCHTWDNGDMGDWVQFRPMAWRNLDELYAGVCDGMMYKEIEKL